MDQFINFNKESYIIKAQNAEIKSESIKSILSNIPEPQINLKQSEVCEGREILETFSCIVCLNIPINPYECNKCDVLFCEQCIKEYREKTYGSLGRKCPYCKQNFEMRVMNRKLKQMTVDQIKFEHRCLQSLDSENNQNLSAFEKFKQTPAYKEILKKQGKIVDSPPPKETPLKLEISSEQSPESKKKRLTKRQEKIQISKAKEDAQKEQEISDQIAADEREKRQLKTYSYDDYLFHLKEDCCAFKLHTCPNKCDCETKMSRKELKEHLLESCPLTELLCVTCGLGKARQLFKKHTAKNCLANLQVKVNSQEQILKRLKTEKDDLMATPTDPPGENPRYMPTYLREREFTRREREGAFYDMGPSFI